MALNHSHQCIVSTFIKQNRYKNKIALINENKVHIFCELLVAVSFLLPVEFSEKLALLQTLDVCNSIVGEF